MGIYRLLLFVMLISLFCSITPATAFAIEENTPANCQGRCVENNLNISSNISIEQNSTIYGGKNRVKDRLK